MSPMPTQLRNRWKNRSEPATGQGTVYWHILLGRYPEVQAAAHAAQQRLSGVSGLHLTPLRWLHMTTLVVGTLDEVSREQMKDMTQLASEKLAATAPIPITLGRVLYHPEAIMLGIRPEGALNPILEATQDATRVVMGKEGQINSGTDWTPHMTLCYSESDQPADPIVEALGNELPGCNVTIDRVNLVVQHGPERLWNWEPVGAARLLGSR